MKKLGLKLQVSDVNAQISSSGTISVSSFEGEVNNSHGVTIGLAVACAVAFGCILASVYYLRRRAKVGTPF